LPVPRTEIGVLRVAGDRNAARTPTPSSTRIAPLHSIDLAKQHLEAASLRLLYSTFAEAFLAFGRIDFAARLSWLCDLRKPSAITGRANNFGQNLTRLFHNDQSLKQNEKLNCEDSGRP